MDGHGAWSNRRRVRGCVEEQTGRALVGTAGTSVHSTRLQSRPRLRWGTPSCIKLRPKQRVMRWRIRIRSQQMEIDPQQQTYRRSRNISKLSRGVVVVFSLMQLWLVTELSRFVWCGGIKSQRQHLYEAKAMSMLPLCSTIRVRRGESDPDNAVNGPLMKRTSSRVQLQW